MPDYGNICMRKFDPDTGQEIPASDAEKQCVIDALREAIQKGQVRYSPQAVKDMGILGLTGDMVESWMAEKH